MLNWDLVFSMPSMALNTVLAITSNDKCELVKCFFFAEFSGIQGSAKFNGWWKVDEKGNWIGKV